MTDQEETRPCPACGAMLVPSDTHWSLFPEPMGGYVCPADDPQGTAADIQQAATGGPDFTDLLHRVSGLPPSVTGLIAKQPSGHAIDAVIERSYGVTYAPVGAAERLERPVSPEKVPGAVSVHSNPPTASVAGPGPAGSPLAAYAHAVSIGDLVHAIPPGTRVASSVVVLLDLEERGVRAIEHVEWDEELHALIVSLA